MKEQVLDGNIPTEKSQHPVAIIDIRMGGSESVVSSLNSSGAEDAKDSLPSTSKALSLSSFQEEGRKLQEEERKLQEEDV